MNEIILELNKFKFNIVALQELRWKDAGTIRRRDFNLYYSGVSGRSGQRGTGFWVNKKIKNKILVFEPISERICKL